MWWIAEYQPVTLFSLKLSSATASGGKSLLIPTPYAIKMALFDAACRVNGIDRAKELWLKIRDFEIGIRPPEKAVVTNLFQKVLRPRRNPIAFTEPDSGPFQKTIGYREYVFLYGNLGIAFSPSAPQDNNWLIDLLWNINYIGKRGGMFQLIAPPNQSDEMPSGFVLVTQDQSAFSILGTLQMLDDSTNSLSFEKANIYDTKSIQSGKDRITRSLVIPMRMECSSRSYTLFERVEP